MALLLMDKLMNYLKVCLVLVYSSRSFDKKPNPVSMSKLLSFGYVEEEKATPGRKLSSEYFRWGSPLTWLTIVH